MHGLLNLLVDSLLSVFVGQSVVSNPLLCLEVGLDEDTLCLGDLLSDGGLLSGNLDSDGGLSDFGVHLLVKGLEVSDLSSGQGLFPAGELLLEFGAVIFLEEIHVGLDVSTEDVVSVLLGVVSTGDLAFLGNGLASLSSDGLLLLEVVAGESLGVVGHVDASVNGSLEDTEHSGSGGGSHETDVEQCSEWASVFIDSLLVDIEEFTVGCLDTLVEVVHSELGEESSSDEETGGVASSIVGETSLETVLLEVGGVGLAEDSIALDGGVDDLDDDLGVGPADAESVLLGVVLVLVLLDESSSCLVIGLSFSSPSILYLISGVMR